MSIFPTKILLATDGSQDAELARTTAVDLATTTDSELHVVTVAPGYPSYDVNVPQVVERLRAQAEKVLEEQVEKIGQAGGKVAQRHLKEADPIGAPSGTANFAGGRGDRGGAHRHGQSRARRCTAGFDGQRL